MTEGANRAATISSFVDRLVNLEQEKRSYAEDIRGVLVEAKDIHELSPKALRALVKRKLETSEQAAKRKVDEEVLDDYLAALGFLD